MTFGGHSLCSIMSTRIKAVVDICILQAHGPCRQGSVCCATVPLAESVQTVEVSGVALLRLNLPTLSYRNLRNDRNLQNINWETGKYDSTVTSNFFTLRENDSITRGHNLKIFKERCRLNNRKNSFIYRSTDVWNSLPQSVVDAPSVQSFEVRIDKLWKNHPIKNILLHHLYYGLCHL